MISTSHLKMSLSSTRPAENPANREKVELFEAKIDWPGWQKGEAETSRCCRSFLLIQPDWFVLTWIRAFHELLQLFLQQQGCCRIHRHQASDFLSATFSNEFDPIRVPAWSMPEKEIENWEGRVKYQFKPHEAHEIIIYNFVSIFGFSNRNNETRENFHWIEMCLSSLISGGFLQLRRRRYLRMKLRWSNELNVDAKCVNI